MLHISLVHSCTLLAALRVGGGPEVASLAQMTGPKVVEQVFSSEEVVTQSGDMKCSC